MGNLLEAMNIHPHAVTIMGLLFSICFGVPLLAGTFQDGRPGLDSVGRLRCSRWPPGQENQTRQLAFGALFDSTVDRYSEIAVFMGLAAYFNSIYTTLLIILAIAGSLLTSYARARAEGLGIECKIGLMQRPERITFLATAAILGGLFDSAIRHE